MRMTDLRPGWTVVGNDGRRVGTIKAIGQHYVLVSQPRLSAGIYVPASAIANVDAQVVHLNLPRDDVSSMGWQQPPREDDALHTAPEADLDRHV